MANIYNFSSNVLLKRIGLSPGKKLLVFLISLVAITIPLSNIYNSISLIFFVLICVLSAKKQEISLRFPLLLPILLFGIMVLSLCWSLDSKISLKALGKEASLVFIPLAFILNRRLNRRAVDDILKNYSLAMCLFCLYCIIRATVRYSSSGNIDVFFYHELSGPDLNAIYCSALISLALFEFISRKNKTFWGYIATLFLLIMVFLLSSKNIIIIDVALIIVYYIFFSGLTKKAITITVCLFCLFASALGYYGKIHERIAHEMRPVAVPTDITGVHNVTVGEAWKTDRFTNNHYFNGTAFRAYQIRIFTEMLQEDPIFFNGYGLNTSSIKVDQKAAEHNIFHGSGEVVGYNKYNFHNQYVETFADLGFFGFLIVIIIVLVNLINGLTAKYFVHIAFAVLMISLFLTESFLWRQRGVVFFTLFYCLFNDLRPLSARLLNLLRPNKVKELEQV
ncbi:hypothetical protein GR160_15245 [Flavobacterium sp. Sd200]|uniref:O-antigen ligase family protein n=1 Tax=Flavobacterium sp. Sd200 TaxID=2692211 RepID=UPI00136A8AEC|nr:O-antigen ligase family protein [Flavobacterium sp. Sd200]MXN92583.1 hypothetical protein [Flavobacterium sp. Sd200]